MPLFSDWDMLFWCKWGSACKGSLGFSIFVAPILRLTLDWFFEGCEWQRNIWLYTAAIGIYVFAFSRDAVAAGAVLLATSLNSPTVAGSNPPAPLWVWSLHDLLMSHRSFSATSVSFHGPKTWGISKLAKAFVRVHVCMYLYVPGLDIWIRWVGTRVRIVSGLGWSPLVGSEQVFRAEVASLINSEIIFWWWWQKLSILVVPRMCSTIYLAHNMKPLWWTAPPSQQGPPWCWPG